MKKFKKLFPAKGDIYTRVAFMGPTAVTIIADGFDDARSEWSEDIPCAEPNLPEMSDEQVTEFTRYVSAIYAVGIAVGLRLDPMLFKGGAR